VTRGQSSVTTRSRGCRGPAVAGETARAREHVAGAIDGPRRALRRHHESLPPAGGHDIERDQLLVEIAGRYASSRARVHEIGEPPERLEDWGGLRGRAEVDSSDEQRHELPHRRVALDEHRAPLAARIGLRCGRQGGDALERCAELPAGHNVIDRVPDLCQRHILIIGGLKQHADRGRETRRVARDPRVAADLLGR